MNSGSVCKIRDSVALVVRRRTAEMPAITAVDFDGRVVRNSTDSDVLEFDLVFQPAARTRCRIDAGRALRLPAGELVDTVDDEIRVGAARMRASIVGDLVLGSDASPLRFSDDPTLDLERRRALADKLAPGTTAAPSGQMSARGTFRVHFNRHGAAPLVWCVATDDWEIAVASVSLVGANVRSVYRAKSTPDDEDGKPSAWLEVTGLVTIVGSEARIS